MTKKFHLAFVSILLIFLTSGCTLWTITTHGNFPGELIVRFNEKDVTMEPEIPCVEIRNSLVQRDGNVVGIYVCMPEYEKNPDEYIKKNPRLNRFMSHKYYLLNFQNDTIKSDIPGLEVEKTGERSYTLKFSLEIRNAETQVTIPVYVEEA